MTDPLGQGLVGAEPAEVCGVGIEGVGKDVEHAESPSHPQNVLQGGAVAALQPQHGVHPDPGPIGDLRGGEVAQLAPGLEVLSELA